jgi:hypothetical protein
MTDFTDRRLQDSLFCAYEIPDFYRAKRLGWTPGALICFMFLVVTCSTRTGASCAAAVKQSVLSPRSSTSWRTRSFAPLNKRAMFQIATKLRGFNRGVTVTAGLDTVFTTPSHGTAFDIVGKGVAKTGAIESAVRLAARLAKVRAMAVH